MAVHRDQTSEVISNKWFEVDVNEGLDSDPKFLSSKYFYDEIGDKLFVQIMNLDEYYLTNSEMEILQEQSLDISNALTNENKALEIIELGAGDGSKTIHFLKAFKHWDFTYKPIDISGHAIHDLVDRFSHYPWLRTKGLVGDYFSLLETLNSNSSKLILFLGSNLGNMTDKNASEFIRRISFILNPGDYFLLGLDLKKDKSIIGPAYNDSKGITAKFNLNLLNRINNELGGNFNLQQFKHSPCYDEEKGIAYSYIESLFDQEVFIGALQKHFSFKKGEKIHTEISRKYDDEILNNILKKSDLTIHSRYTDRKGYFCNYLLKKT